MNKGLWSRASVGAVEALDLPAELAYGVPQMELLGQRQFFMAGHKGVLSYSTELVELSGGTLVVRLIGRELQLLSMTEDGVRPGGVIEKVELVSLCTEKP